MKPNIGPEDDESLDHSLRQWTVEAPLPPRLQEQVWSRIHRTETGTRPEPGLWAGLSRLIEGVLPRPQFALAYLAAFLALGVTAGAVTAQHKTSRLDSQLGLRYVQSIDPYLVGPAQR